MTGATTSTGRDPFRAIFDTLLEGIQIIGFDWRYLYLNAAAERHNRRPNQELLGNVYMEMWPGIEATQVFAVIKRCMEERDDSQIENAFTFPDGAIHWFELRIQPVPEGLLILSIDITARKQAEAELQQAHELIELAHEAGAIGIWQNNLATGAVHLDEYARRHYGFDVHDMTIADVLASVHPDDVDRVVNEIGAATGPDGSGRFTTEYRVIHPDGSVRWLAVGVRVWFEKHEGVWRATMGFGTTQDITERKQAEAALRQSEERHRLISDLISDYVYSGRIFADGSSITEWSSGAFESITGYTTEEINALPAGFSSLIVPEDLEHIIAQQQTLFSFQANTVEYRLRRKDGQIRWLRDYMQLLPEEHAENAFKLIGAVQDITDRKQTETALRLSEEKYRGLMESLDNVIAMVDADGRFLYLNDLAAAQLGGSPQDFIGRTMHELFPEEVANRQLEHIRIAIHDDQGQIYEAQSVVRGQLRWYRTSIQPIHDEQGQVSAAIINSTDIHNLKTAQQDLLELNRTLEERVRQRTAEVRDLYEHAPTGYHSLDADGNLIIINQTELDWLDYTREELLGHPYMPLLTAASQQIFSKQFPAFRLSGSIRSLDLELVRKDGTILPILISAIAVYDDAGNYVMSRSTVFDNTERKRADDALRESEAQNRLLFEEVPDAVVLFDKTGRMARMNRAFERMTGYTSAQLVGQTLDEQGLLSAEQMASLATYVTETLKTEDFAARTFKLSRADGEIRDVGMRVFGILIRGIQHYLTTIRDITAEKQAEDALRLANAELARAARAKDEFLANMSHELRTPLHAILAFSETLLEAIHGPLNSRQENSLRHIEASGRHLLALINDILDLSKIEAGRLDIQIEAIPIDEVCQASLQFVKELALKKSLQLDFQIDVHLSTMEADPKRLKQMLVNLLSNAVKFTPAGGRVRLKVAADPSGDVIHFAVQDSGIGIAPGDLARLFHPFSQLDSSLSRQYEGTGLGLALVHRLVDLHGGSITVESRLNEGSCFTISLPYHPPESAALSPAGSLVSRTADTGTSPAIAVVNEPQNGTGRAPEPTSMSGHVQILLAEDNEITIEAIEAYLHARGYQVAVAHNGREALDRASATCPDLILMDIQMPEMDGLEAIRRLRSSSGCVTTPIIALTALVMPGDRERCLDAGANEYLTKPVSLKGLVETIERFVVRR